MKVLVLSCSTGEGHNAAAAAIAGEFRDRGVESEHYDVLHFARKETTLRRVEHAYDDAVVKHPNTFRRAYRIGERITSPNRKSPPYHWNSRYADNLGGYIENGGFDVVISTHMFPAEALTHLLHEGLDVRTYAVATDYLCLPFWEECDMDLFVVPHVDVIDEYVQRGIPRERIAPLGLPVARWFRVTVPKEEARLHLGLAEAGTVYLVLTGSMGFGDVGDLPDELLAGDPAARVIVVAGHNARLATDLGRRYAGDARVQTVGFTDEIAVYMDAADVVLSKPGGLTSTEVAAKGRPLVHTPAIPGFEARNASFFSERGMSLFADDYEASAEAAIMLAHDADARDAMRRAQRANIDAYASARIAERVEADGRKA